MDAISVILSALVNGFLSAVAEDAYKALKNAIQRKYSHINIAKLEENPTSIQYQEEIRKELKNSGIENDSEILSLATGLLDVIEVEITPKRRADLIKSRNPNDYIEYAQWNGGLLALKQIFEKHFIDIIKIRDEFPVRNLDLISGRVASNNQIPRPITSDINNLHNKVRDIIQKTAIFIESRKMQEAEKYVEEMDLANVDKEKARRLVQTDKKINVSYQTLKSTVEYFVEINKYIQSRIETSNSQKQEARLAIGNAILVYELTDYVIKYIEAFDLTGHQELMRLYNETKAKTQELRKSQKDLEAMSNRENVDASVKAQTLENIRLREETILILEREWDEYIKSVETLKNDLGSVKLKIPTLQVIREDSKIQIEILQEVEMLRVLKQNITTVESAILTLENIQLISLSPDRVRRLLGVSH